MDKKNRPFRPVPFFIHIFLISEYQLIFFSIRRCRINHEFLCPKIRIQLRRISIALSHNDESAVLTVLHFKAVIKSGEGIPEFHQLYQLLYHGPLHFFRNLFFRIIMAVDIPAHLGLFQKLQIVLSRHKPHVIYLRDARCEELDRPCQKICLVVVSQRGIISTIHLINIQVIISGRIINLLYVCAVFKNILFRPVDFLIGKKILNVHHADPVMGIQCGKLLSGTDFQPFFRYPVCP